MSEFTLSEAAGHARLGRSRTCPTMCDIEQEVNGLHAYDRRAKSDPAVIRAINEQKAAIER